MTPIRITTHIDSDTLHLPELGPWVGKTVEITIAEMPSEDDCGVPPVSTDFFMALRPRSPVVTDEETHELRRAAATDPALAAALSLADSDAIDADAIARLRAASMI